MNYCGSNLQMCQCMSVCVVCILVLIHQLTVHLTECTYPSPCGFSANSLKFVTVLGTVLPNKPISMRPADSPPMVMSKKTYAAIEYIQTHCDLSVYFHVYTKVT